ncbi:hypothetical protein HK103_003610 [Boothiomyces macroporosus]|uniref:Protein kinase domain-containing protein n=1 Tax=Boothiomyces macroporosus TaxID=261099 RepID=A0AAD5UHP9_9FUNG|nr:hypothetical protein HK103_003610 [Boothiomyces macroporosus]
MDSNLKIFSQSILDKLNPSSVTTVLGKQNQVVYRIIIDQDILYLKIVKESRKNEVEVLKLFPFTPRVIEEFKGLEYFGFLLSNVGISLSTYTKWNVFEYRHFLLFVKSVTECLNAIHEQGFIHLDINPGNICLLDNVVSIIDFGLTEKMEGNCLPGGYRFGIPRYKAPEIAKNGPSIDKSVDFYALGKIILEMLDKNVINMDQQQSRLIFHLAEQMAASNPAERISGIEILKLLREYI